jgi:acyl-CoA synthetase (NDP forming)
MRMGRTKGTHHGECRVESETEARAVPILGESKRDPRIERMFNPQAIALVGVSGREDSLMARPLRYLIDRQFGGRIYPVNPKYEQLGGIRCYPSLSELPGPIDLALIMVPARQVADAIRECGRAGASGAVVFASGFAEAGSGGQQLQLDIAEAAESAGVRVLGPNCQGLLYAPTGLFATFTPLTNRAWDTAQKTGVAYVGQSGAVGGSLLDLAAEVGIDLTAWVSTGNQVDLDVVTVASHLLADPSIAVLALYVETMQDGKAYAQLAARARAAGKRLVVLHGGRSQSGREAAVSHTGAMLGDHTAFTLVSRRHGVVLAKDVSDWLGAAAAIRAGATSVGRQVAVVTTSGAAGSITADQFEDYGLELPELTSATQARLSELVPSFGSVSNPVDVTGQLFNRGAEAFGEVCRVVAEDPLVNAIAVVLTMVTGMQAAGVAKDIIRTSASIKIPLFITWLAGQNQTAEGRNVFRRAGWPVFTSPGELARVIDILAASSTDEDLDRWKEPAEPAECGTLSVQKPQTNKGDDVIKVGQDFLGALGIHQPTGLVVTSSDEAERFARQINGAVAMKLHIPALTHKSDVGGVRLGVDPSEAARVFTELMMVVPAEWIAEPAGVLVQEMVPKGVELIMRIAAGENGFPPVITVGFGGVTTELYHDVASAIAPVAEGEAVELLQRLKAWPLLAGFRGEPPMDVRAAANAVARLSASAPALIQYGLDEVEVNPLIVGVDGSGAIAVDVLVRRSSDR